MTTQQMAAIVAAALAAHDPAEIEDSDSVVFVLDAPSADDGNVVHAYGYDGTAFAITVTTLPK